MMALLPSAGEDHEVHVDVRVHLRHAEESGRTGAKKACSVKISIIVWNVLDALNLPPLRDCPQDIMPLTELFVARFADEQGRAASETGR